MNELFEPLNPLIDQIISWLPAFGIALIVLIVAIRFGVEWMIQRHQRWRNYREKRGWKPAAWFKAEPRAHFKTESVLLAHDGIREMYAPSSAFLRDLREKEAAWQFAWLSPNARAVRASIKKNRGLAKGKKLEARKQIAEASKYIIVRELPATERVLGDPSEHFRIDFQLNGADPEEFRRMTGKIRSQLGLHSIKEIDSMDNYIVSFAAHKTEPIDPLTEQKAGIEFFEDHEAPTPYSIPLAVRENGKPWFLSTHHTLIDGMTGSGKGSPLNGIIRQLAPYVKKGRAKLYGIDPKASELRPYEESSLFKEVVYENADAQEVIAQIHKIMKTRSKTKKVDVENADLGRSLDATLENPMIVLLIDELLSLLIALQGLGREGKASMTLLTEILAQGRSLGVYVIGATQEVDKDLLGRMRGNFANIIMLKQPSAYFNDLFLGEGAKDKGFDSTAIPLSTKANGYAYAGIGYVKEETGNPVKVRFAYSSDKDISDLIKEFPKEGYSTRTAETESESSDDGDFAISDSPDDFSAAFEQFVLEEESKN